eukprot:CAMPEP_0172160930 /NCGR_PEP_ID=MMETSP1050-20130122/5835_1 /TAXON_ID=233186 /ORGANISM="Cryptomonas curvata, Strain CCAP979/52" /LENGTH=262 /DNA_ID=CAMNT_0012830755 /DNA_START=144 /DNA_END=932 /DNA_ORIENTATION=+
MREEDFHSLVLPPEVQSWAQFKVIVPEWDDVPNSFVWFRDAISSNPLQRAQNAGLCYIHTPVLLVSYLQLKLGMKDGKMINIVKWIKDSFNAEDLRRHIFDDEGGDSKDILSSFMSDFIKPWFEVDAALMLEYGPAMVSRFSVSEDFADADQLRHHGKPGVLVKGRHSMLLVGVRFEKLSDGNVEKIFLLQNWWKQKQFVEFSESYLVACKAEAVFVKGPQHLLSTIPSVIANYAETADVEHQERYDLETLFWTKEMAFGST